MPSPAAMELLAARARRISSIRRRVAAATLAMFALAWGVVAWDGSMGTTDTATAHVTTTSSSDAGEPLTAVTTAQS